MARIGELKRELEEQQATLQRTEHAKGEIAKAAATLERELSTVEPADEETPVEATGRHSVDETRRVAANKTHRAKRRGATSRPGIQPADVRNRDMRPGEERCAGMGRIPVAGLSFSESSVLTQRCAVHPGITGQATPSRCSYRPCAQSYRARHPGPRCESAGRGVNETHGRSGRETRGANLAGGC